MFPFSNLKKELSGALEPDLLAVSYNLGSYFGDFMSDACSIEDEGTRSSISSLVYFKYHDY
jgi:hypothetical protein